MIKVYDFKAKHVNEKTALSWKLAGDCGQGKYELSILSKAGKILWTSGSVEGAERHNIAVDTVLPKNEIVKAAVRVEGVDGSTDTAETDFFFTGINSWKAKWIEPERTRKPITDVKNPHEPVKEVNQLERLDPSIYFRREIEISKEIEQSIAYVTAHGIYAMWVNGQLVSDILAPGYTSYGKRLEYQCIDLSKLLVDGKNTIAFIVADGWYTGKIGAVGYGQQYGTESALLFQIENTYTDGSNDTFFSDKNTKWSTGAYQYADLFVGEYCDSRLEPAGWKENGFEECNWMQPLEKEYGYSNLFLQGIDPVVETEEIIPELIRTPKGEIVLDAGRTVVGYASFAIEMEKNQEVSFEYSETLDTAGNFLQNIIGHNKNQTDYYIADHTGINEYKPLFTYHGLRYIRVKGLTDIDVNNVKIHVISSKMTDTGKFICSDERLNILADNILSSQKGNMICIPTDCPQREKTGWTGDAQVYAPTACYEQDVEQFFRHWLADMRNEQLENGEVPHIIPYIPSHDYMKPAGIEGVSAAGWSDAAIILPWRLYEAYGDRKILEENFDMIYRYMESLREIAKEIPEQYKDAAPEVKERQQYLWNTGFQYGDWLLPSIIMAGNPIFQVIVETGHIVSSLMYAITTDLMVKVCEVLGKSELADDYRNLNESVKKAFREEYVDEAGNLKKDYQGVYVLALQADVLTAEQRTIALNRLVEKIHENGNRLDTGFLSVAYLLPVLAKNGQLALANELLMQDKCPSWLYEVKMGATTMWEYWSGYAEDGTPDECSMNHFAFGCVGEYLFRSVLGIDSLEPGFKKIRICPDMNNDLEYAKGHYDSIWGDIKVSWKKKGGVVQMNVVIPPDVEAEICIGDNIYYYGVGEWNL